MKVNSGTTGQSLLLPGLSGGFSGNFRFGNRGSLRQKKCSGLGSLIPHHLGYLNM